MQSSALFRHCRQLDKIANRIPQWIVEQIRVSGTFGGGYTVTRLDLGNSVGEVLATDDELRKCLKKYGMSERQIANVIRDLAWSRREMTLSLGV
jgi:hypothetical protein